MRKRQRMRMRMRMIFNRCCNFATVGLRGIIKERKILMVCDDPISRCCCWFSGCFLPLILFGGTGDGQVELIRKTGYTWALCARFSKKPSLSSVAICSHPLYHWIVCWCLACVLRNITLQTHFSTHALTYATVQITHAIVSLGSSFYVIFNKITQLNEFDGVYVSLCFVMAMWPGL